MVDEHIGQGTMRQTVALTVAGSDSGGNAGIQADLRAFHFFGVHGCTVLAALTAQNPFRVRSALVPEASFVEDQLDAVLEAYAVGALKTGMLAESAVIEAVAGRLMPHGRIVKVFDPVMVASSGARLLRDDAVETLKRSLLPLADLITPNLPETRVLSGKTLGLDDDEDVAMAACDLADKFGCAVLVKGGHRGGAAAADLLYDGERLYRFSTPRLDSPLSTHGTGCSLSAAITAALACGKGLVEAVTEGKAYVYESIRSAVMVGECAAVLGTPARLPVEAVRVEKA
ncbi:MAG: bifunctional hydroxymethylpyrimidine kinase/phosphomethylpyrimidine kinase [Kiritimatiellae bacterium]|nr:bifunctional hydroxymethylpyrimidine kinase/phosphomethylpyrimidine kinase [Kiritimatiellia bacterium]MDD3543981.1 bifunctional hydroxymethylpyrimidine kinase/phosphomethylpyrimidine kinase [Kiritimatiellia bacterium]MDD4622020.1 bifunctional hydroxymethylpyrimidine kinase/phosphomethylpyrimidine kinase [Kiritimatiellia bacterium]